MIFYFLNFFETAFHYVALVDQAMGTKLATQRDQPASASRMLGIKGINSHHTYLAIKYFFKQDLEFQHLKQEDCTKS